MRAIACFGLLLSLVAAGCGPSVDLARTLRVQDVSTGWFDAGIIDGKAKLVPSITFKLANGSDQKLAVLQVNALFRRINEPNAEWGSAFITAAGSEGAAAGATIGPFTIRSDRGYTGTDQTRDEMLHNKQFVDAKVDLFAKYGSTQWAKIGEFTVERRLLTK
jgi:hypothetical protein